MHYDELCAANIAAFLESPHYRAKLTCWRIFSQKLQEKGIKFALACSGGMFFSGIIDDFHDWDILIFPEDIDAVEEALLEIGEKISIHSEDDRFFNDSYFASFKIAGVDIDVISEFTLVTFGTSYRYELRPEHIRTLLLPDSTTVPIIPLEAQYLLYAMMCGWQPQRKFKRNLLYEYLMERGSEYPGILENALRLPLPYWIKQDVKAFLKK